MKPTFQTASEDLKQTSILFFHQQAQTYDCQTVYRCLLLYSFYCAVLLNSSSRAVEFFIRDKYEKKKYYSKNVINGSSVCMNQKVSSLDMKQI